MKLRIPETGITYKFDKPVYNITINNIGKVRILINGDTVEDAITLRPNNRKSLGFAGLEEIYFTTEIKTDRQDGSIEITSLEYLKPIFRGTLDTTEIPLDFTTLAHGITVKNMSGNDFYISLNKKMDGDITQAYRIKENEFIQLEQNIEKVWLMSEGNSVYELYAYRKPGTPMSY